jgi:hypothetical protein
MTRHQSDADARAYFQQHPEALRAAGVAGFISPAAIEVFLNTSARTAKEAKEAAQKLNEDARERQRRKDHEHDERMRLAGLQPAARAGQGRRAPRPLLDAGEVYRARGGAR